ncbi:hypothetical protein ACVJGD_003909 [Bradyrhizobium sp. USDA 10063]
MMFTLRNVSKGFTRDQTRSCCFTDTFFEAVREVTIIIAWRYLTPKRMVLSSSLHWARVSDSD